MDGSSPAFLTAFIEDPVFVGNFSSADAGGILYVEDFDAEPEPPPPQPDPAPVYTEADLEAARAAGRADGMQAALGDAILVQTQLQAAATQALADALTNARVTLDRVAAARAEAVAGSVLAVLQAALPALMARHAAEQADAMVRALLPGLRCEAELRVRAHPDLAPVLHAALAAGLAPDSDRFFVVADPALAPGDVQIAWKDGGATRDVAAVWEAVRAALAGLALPTIAEVCGGCGN